MTIQFDTQSMRFHRVRLVEPFNCWADGISYGRSVDYRATRGTVADVSGAYNNVYRSRKHTGPRTSLIIVPPDGKMPAVTQEVQNRRKVWRGHELMLLQASAACKDHEAVCAGGEYLPPSPRFHDARIPFICASPALRS